MKEMLAAKGISFDAYPAFFTQGSFIRRRSVERTLTEAERNRIPEKHRPPADTMVTRSEVSVVPMPELERVTNRTEVVFDGADPTTETNPDVPVDKGD